MSNSANNSNISLYISLGILAALILAYFVIAPYQEFINEAYNIIRSGDRQRISAWVRQYGWWGPAVIVLTMVMQMFLLVVPSWLLMIVSVLSYGPVWGALLSILAVFVASSVGYALGVGMSTHTLYRIIGKDTEEKLEDYIEDYGLWAVVLFRLSPFLSNDAISIVGGLLRMGYWRFIGATIIGITPLAIAIGWLGENADRLKSGLIWGSAICIVLFAAYIYFDRFVRNS